jgi:hypothetical protein
MHKPQYKTEKQAYDRANAMFMFDAQKPIRETTEYFKIRNIPKTKFKESSFVQYQPVPGITLVYGFLK